MEWMRDPNLYPPYLRARIRKGRGVGKGTGYKRWLNIRDVPSQGTSSSVEGILIPRPYHMLSELETIYFYLTERKPSVVDIREQWPVLDIDRTLELCAQQGIRHKFDGTYPEPFTIDFVITEKLDGKLYHRAASIKTVKDAADLGVRRRLYVEHTWCEEQGLPWKLVDTSGFDKKLLSVLNFMRGWFQNRFEPDASTVARFGDTFLDLYSTSLSLKTLISLSAKRLCISEELAENLFRYCAWSNQIPVSLRHQLMMNRPVALELSDYNA
jgi:hypothetical protein